MFTVGVVPKLDCAKNSKPLKSVVYLASRLGKFMISPAAVCHWPYMLRLSGLADLMTCSGKYNGNT